MEPWIYDIMYDPDDVDLTDYVELTTVIHGTLCPQIMEDPRDVLNAH